MSEIRQTSSKFGWHPVFSTVSAPFPSSLFFYWSHWHVRRVASSTEHTSSCCISFLRGNPPLPWFKGQSSGWNCGVSDRERKSSRDTEMVLWDGLLLRIWCYLVYDCWKRFKKFVAYWSPKQIFYRIFRALFCQDPTVPSVTPQEHIQGSINSLRGSRISIARAWTHTATSASMPTKEDGADLPLSSTKLQNGLR